MTIVLRAIFMLAFISNAFAGNHGESHHMDGNSPEWEIKAYTSAAPSFIGNHATVIGASGEVLRGTMVGGANRSYRCRRVALKIHDTAAACSDKNAVAWADAYKANTT